MEQHAAELIVQTFRAAAAGKEATFLQRIIGASPARGIPPANLTDAQILSIVKGNPEAFKQIVLESRLPDLVQEARDRVARRKFMGSSAAGGDDQGGDRQPDPPRARRSGWGKWPTGGCSPARRPLGDFMAFVDAADLGTPGLITKLDTADRGDGFDAGQRWQMMRGVLRSTPVQQLPLLDAGLPHARLAGVLPGQRAGALRGANNARNAIAGVAAQRTLGAAASYALTEVPAQQAFERAPWLARRGATSLSAGLEMPLYNSITPRSRARAGGRWSR